MIDLNFFIYFFLLLGSVMGTVHYSHFYQCKVETLCVDSWAEKATLCGKLHFKFTIDLNFFFFFLLLEVQWVLCFNDSLQLFSITFCVTNESLHETMPCGKMCRIAPNGGVRRDDTNS